MSPLLKEGCLPLLAFCFLFKQIASPFGWPTHFHFGISFPVLLIHSGIGTHISFFFNKVLLKLCSQRRRKERIERRQSFFFFFAFLEPHPQHVEVSILGVKSELQLLAYATGIAMRDPRCVCDLHHSSQQCRIPDPLSKARDQTCILVHTS